MGVRAAERVPPASGAVLMRRQRVRLALIGLVLVVLAGIGFLVGRTLVRQQQATAPTEEEIIEEDVAQRLRRFRRMKVEEGRTIWDLRAERADFLDEGRVRIDAPSLSFFAEDGREVRLSGVRGEVMLEGGDVQSIDLDGGIEVSVAGYRLQAPVASWVGSSNVVIAREGADLSGEGISIEGEVMTVELDQRRVHFTGAVRTVVERSGTRPRASLMPPSSSRRREQADQREAAGDS